jgi:hypothetical protein
VLILLCATGLIAAGASAGTCRPFPLGNQRTEIINVATIAFDGFAELAEHVVRDVH